MLGYYVDWTMELLGIVTFLTGCMNSGLLFIGLYLYLYGMAIELECQVSKIDGKQVTQSKYQFTYCIRLHNEIIW